MRRFILLLAALAQAVWTIPAAAADLEIRVVYDNTSARQDVEAHWGFAAVVTFRGQRILFDSGTEPELFMENLGKLGVSPESIEKAIISHEHRDHRGGIYALYALNRSMPVFFLDNFLPEAWDEARAIGLEPRRVREPFELISGAWSTGLIPGEPVDEQSLAIETEKGIVLVVGCSHPGIVRIVETVKRQRGATGIRLALGGLHMFQQERPAIEEQIRQLQALGVERIMPAHCSGDLAKELFQRAYGENYEPLGAGKILRLD